MVFGFVGSPRVFVFFGFYFVPPLGGQAQTKSYLELSVFHVLTVGSIFWRRDTVLSWVQI